VSSVNDKFFYIIVYNFGFRRLGAPGSPRYTREGDRMEQTLPKRGTSPERASRRVTSSTEAIVRDMRERIASRQIQPGSRIQEEALAGDYDVPRAKAREALAVLEDRSLVQRVANKGATACVIDMDTTRSLYEVREALDGLAVRLAIRNSSKDDWAEIAALMRGPFEESLAAGDIDMHIGIIEQFRRRLIELARNPILADMLDRLYDRTRTTMRRVALLPGRSQAGMVQYRQVLAAILERDEDAAEQAFRTLNQSAQDYMTRYKDYVI
jgi:DNA-binding GntR family transcriptional regulator